MIKNREVFDRDPVTAKLLNDGVASVTEITTQKQVETLKYELEHFVCEGQYQDGFVRVLESFLGNIDSGSQPAAWVSGFFGSGKSHLLKMFRHLWVNTEFGSENVTARGLATLPQNVKDLLRELDTTGRRYGGLHAASGTLPSGGGESVRLAVISIILRSCGLPESLPQAQFCIWLQKNGIFDEVKRAVEAGGRDFDDELHDLYVSPVLADAVLAADRDFASSQKEARAALRSQFPDVEDLSTNEFIRTVRGVLTANGQLPCTVLVLDEIQLFIGNSPSRSADVQDVAEELCKQLDSRLLLIGSGQAALAGDDPLLQRLRARFPMTVQLSDADVETVTRKVILKKKPDKQDHLADFLESHSGEIARQLADSRIAYRQEDQPNLVSDYPLLPVRRRFWERVLRSVDVPGTASQLRTQLKIVHEAVRRTAEEPVGTVVPADFIFDQLQPILAQSRELLPEIDAAIKKLASPLAKRLCGLVFLIRKLPREGAADIGVRATPAMLADLLVCDLSSDGAELRQQIPKELDQLVKDGLLIKVDDEYSLQTRESSEWEREFRSRAAIINADQVRLASKRNDYLRAECSNGLKRIKLTQGKSKEPRDLHAHVGDDPPPADGRDIEVWIRDGWSDKESTIVKDAREAGNDSPLVFVFIQKANAEGLQKAIADAQAASETLQVKPDPTSPEGIEAREAMATRQQTAETSIANLVREVVEQAKVFQGGGHEKYEIGFSAKVESAARDSLSRMFPNFRDADDDRWPTVINRAKKGDAEAFQSVDWQESPERHPVCSSVMTEIGPSKRGKDIRAAFEVRPYGWPRDAVDAALITLHTCEHLRAKHKGLILKVGELDQAKIPAADFHVESQILSAQQKKSLRKLLMKGEITCKPGEEQDKAAEFLVQLLDFADRTSGEPPLPERPSTVHIDDLRNLIGNDQLIAILEDEDRLSRNAEEWAELAKLAEERKPEWEQLQALLRHAEGLQEAEETRTQADSIVEQRILLQPEDPVIGLIKAAAEILRKAVSDKHSLFGDLYKGLQSALKATENWKGIKTDVRKGILSQHEITGVPKLKVGSESELLTSLEQISLGTWKTLTDALPHRFAQAALAAAKMLEPKTQDVYLSSNILRTENDVRQWIKTTEKSLLGKLRKGPIIISRGSHEQG